jgi:hypothetical protein
VYALVSGHPTRVENGRTLTTYASIVVLDGVSVDVRVQEVLGTLVLERDGIVVSDLCSPRQRPCRNRLRMGLTLGVQRQGTVDETQLEGRAHEVVSRSALGEDEEVDPEPEEVDDGRDDDQAERSSSKVLRDVLL